MNRRNWLLGGAGVAAAAAGVAWQQWRSGGAVAPGVAPAGPPLDEASAALWQSTFTGTDGQPLVMARLRGQPLVLNFWGTWCPPCVKEMPELDRFAREVAPRGVRVLGLAIDSPTPVREFLARTPVSYTIALAALEGTDLSRKLGNTSGALPFTAVFNRQGALVQRKLGTTSLEELRGWAAHL